MAKENAVVKKFDELGRVKGGGTGLAGQGRGKLVSYDWVTKSSPGLPVFDRPGLKVSCHFVFSKSHIFANI